MENSEIKMDLLVAIKPAKLHDLDYTEMQVALEQFGDLALLDLFREIQSKTKRVQHLMKIYLTNRPSGGEVPRNHPLYKLYCRLLANNYMLCELQLEYVREYNNHARQFGLPEF